MIVNNSCLLKLLGRYAKMQSPKYEFDKLVCSADREVAGLIRSAIGNCRAGLLYKSGVIGLTSSRNQELMS